MDTQCGTENFHLEGQILNPLSWQCPSWSHILLSENVFLIFAHYEAILKKELKKFFIVIGWWDDTNFFNKNRADIIKAIRLWDILWKCLIQLFLWNVVVIVWNLSYSSVLCGFYATQSLRIQMSFKVKALLFVLKQQFTSVILS